MQFDTVPGMAPESLPDGLASTRLPVQARVRTWFTLLDLSSCDKHKSLIGLARLSCPSSLIQGHSIRLFLKHTVRQCTGTRLTD